MSTGISTDDRLPEGIWIHDWVRHYKKDPGFPVPERHKVIAAVCEAIDSAHYDDEEDTNTHFVVAIGAMAKLAAQAAKEKHPAFTARTLGLDLPDDDVGLWSFPTMEAAGVIFDGITDLDQGTAFYVEAERGVRCVDKAA